MKIDGDLIRAIIVFLFFTTLFLIVMIGGCKASYDLLSHFVKSYG